MIGRTNVGGGDNLNFKIVGGTAQPSNPKENTIWVNTSTAIHAWDFSATEPIRRSKNKNLLVHPYHEASNTDAGITWTVNSDGSITANGTATGNAIIYLTSQSIITKDVILSVPAGAYIFSGCPAGGSSKTYWVSVSYSYDGWATTKYASDVGAGVRLTVDYEAEVLIACRVMSGTTVSNIVFKPQLEKGSAATSFVKGDATGQVWIQTGSASNGAFNALKKNGIMVYPVKVKQYQNGEWKDRDAQVYQNGEWKELRTYLFKSGTGAVVPFSKNNASAASITIGTNSISITMGNEQYGLANVFTNNKIAFKAGDVLVFDAKCTSTTADASGNYARRVGVYTTQHGTSGDTSIGTMVAGVLLTANSTRKEYRVPIESAGSYYVQSAGCGAAEIHNIWIE